MTTFALATSSPAGARSSGQLMFVRTRGCASMTRKYLVSAEQKHHAQAPMQQALNLAALSVAISQVSGLRAHARGRGERARGEREGDLPDTCGWSWPARPAASPPSAVTNLANTVWMPGGHGPGARSSTSLLLVLSHSAPSTNTATCARNLPPVTIAMTPHRRQQHTPRVLFMGV